MFSREFEYTDYNGNKKTAKYWFSLERDEMLRMEMGNYGGLEYTMKKLLREKEPGKVIDLMEEIVLSAVGEVSPNGDSFYKSQKIRDDFRQTKVCHDLLFEMMSNQDALRNFILGAIPADISMQILEEEKKNENATENVASLPSTQGAMGDAGN